MIEEWNLLSLAYKNAVGSRRAVWRVITSTEQQEKFKGKEELVLHASEYVANVEGKLQKIRDGILALMDKNLIPSPNTDELKMFYYKMFYYKMKGDYYRHLAEVTTGEQRAKPVKMLVSLMRKPLRSQRKTWSWPILSVWPWHCPPLMRSLPWRRDRSPSTRLFKRS